MATMEEAFDMVETLTQELVDKEEKIIELEKQVDKYKTLFGECDQFFHGQIEYELRRSYNSLRESTQLEPHLIYGLQIYEAPNYILPEMLPESIEMWNDTNEFELKEGWVVKYYPEYSDDTIWIQKKDKVFNKKDLVL